jgi:hypothetical protein
MIVATAAHAVDYRWTNTFSQGTFEAIIENANDASVNIYCPAGQEDHTPGIFISSSKVKPAAKERVTVQIVVDGENHPFDFDEIRFLANSNRAMLNLQALIDALSASKQKHFIVEFPKYKVSETFSSLDARKSLRVGKKSIIDGCDQ